MSQQTRTYGVKIHDVWRRALRLNLSPKLVRVNLDYRAGYSDGSLGYDSIEDQYAPDAAATEYGRGFADGAWDALMRAVEPSPDLPAPTDPTPAPEPVATDSDSPLAINLADLDHGLPAHLRHLPMSYVLDSGFWRGACSCGWRSTETHNPAYVSAAYAAYAARWTAMVHAGHPLTLTPVEH